jgi:hypothetical protein
MQASLRSTFHWWLQRSVLFVGLCVIAGAVNAQDLVHVEEDWELVIATPDSNSCGPQVVCAMSPFSDISSTYFTLEINHRSFPYWAPGGLTLHQWNGENSVQTMDRADRSVMNTSDEVVTWTSVLDCQGALLTFRAKNGTSSTWGAWGYTGNFKLVSAWVGGNLNNYSPDVSTSQSGVAYASNRVRSLKLLEVRGTLSDGTTATDNTPRVVYQLSQ